MAGDPVYTHVFNGVHLLFPRMERMMIKVVAGARAGCTDPALDAQARAFIQQEARHAHQHGLFLKQLESQGFDIDGVLARQDRVMGLVERLPVPLALSIVAGGEHHTAMLGHGALCFDPLDGAPEGVRALLRWHAAEEIEHKAVAFDLLAHVAPGYGLRILGLLGGTLMVGGLWAAASLSLLAQELRHSGPGVFLNRPRGLGRRLPPATEFAARIVDYLRPGFHPWDEDDAERVAQWMAGLRSVGA
ncbi:MAG: metal-dependent hydrolase [Alphaproteobacteria bacterium]|nr:metal-dependent hydrolase [Alphaproteobacteria bacterium]